MTYNKGDFYTYISAYRVEKGCEFTHTSITKPTGSFYIPSEKLDEFYKIYRNAMKSGEDLYVTEKHRDLSPLLIDIDLRFEKLNDDNLIIRKYDDQFIQDIVNLYFTKINEYIENSIDIKFYIMEKSKAVLNKGLIKDGLHIVVPNIVTKPAVQHLIRKDVIAELGLIFEKLQIRIPSAIIKNSLENIIDEAVIHKNNWQMYGSKKPTSEPYKVTSILRYTGSHLSDNLEFIKEEINKEDDIYVEEFSIRNKYDCSKIKIEKLNKVQEFEQKELSQKKTLKMNPALQVNQNNKKNICDNIEFVEKLIGILSEKRADSFEDWIRVGWCLRTVDYRLLPNWIEFSKKSVKFQDGECEKLWPFMKDDGLGLGTLHMWAKKDNEERYKELLKKDLFNLISSSASEAHSDIAKVIYFIYQYSYVCVSIKLNLWYEYRNHRWVSCDSGHTLRSKLSDEVVREYNRHAAIFSTKASEATDNDEQERYTTKAKHLTSIALKLRNVAFKDNIMKESRELFYIEKFDEKLDSRCNLIGFENGVYDLDADEFRDGRPEDYISFSTGINYIVYNPDSNSAKEMNSFISQIFTNSNVRSYVLSLLSSFLNGNIREEKFHIWTGSGCFAKNTKIMMYNGYDKNVQDIKVGDILMGDDSTPRNVQQLFTGYSDMYRIIPIKGDPFIVNGGHDLVVKASNMFNISKKEYNQYRAIWVEYDEHNILKNKSKLVNNQNEAIKIMEDMKLNIKTVKKDDIIKMTVHQYLNLPKSIQILLNLYRPEFVEFKEQSVKMDPWALGYLLGDGSQFDTSFTTEDIEVLDYYKNVCDKGLAKTYEISGKSYRINTIRDALKDYNLFKNKHIPDQYKFNSKEVRMGILAGLIDSDGHYQKKMKQIEITQKSEKLIDDIIWIARSLGLSCYKSKIRKQCINNGVWDNYYRIQLVGKVLHEIPVIIPRKKADKRTCLHDPLILSFKVERVQDDNFYGFELDGNNRFLAGGGDFTVLKNSNGKSKITELFENSFGEYCVKFPITLLTQKRAASNAASSELARAKGKRFASLQEPSEDEKLNIGLMKEISGGDKIQARMIYKEPVEFKPQFKMILACNHLPNVPSDDGGTWRRIRVVEFTSRFCENPDKEKPNEFKMDTELSSRFEDWKEHFMALLIDHYRQYKISGIIEPEEVLKCTREYQRSNDAYLDFIESELDRSDFAYLSQNDAFACFKTWVNDNAPAHFKNIQKKPFIKALEKIMGKVISFNKTEGWKGWVFKNANINQQDELD